MLLKLVCHQPGEAGGIWFAILLSEVGYKPFAAVDGWSSCCPLQPSAAFSLALREITSIAYGC